MPDSKQKLQDVLIEGATQGLSGEPLFQFVKEQTKAKDKKIIHAAFYALSDPDLKDRSTLDVLYALGLSHRLRNDDEAADTVEAKPASKAASLPLPEKIKKKDRPKK